jgi:hypothetical protein
MGAQLRALLALEGAVRADARFSAQAMVAVSVHRRPARILTVIVGNPGLRRSIDRLIPSPIDQNSCAHWRNPRDMMRQG